MGLLRQVSFSPNYRLPYQILWVNLRLNPPLFWPANDGVCDLETHLEGDHKMEGAGHSGSTGLWKRLVGRGRPVFRIL
jgi:hypothetical protein